jgi:hypothetical protein
VGNIFYGIFVFFIVFIYNNIGRYYDRDVVVLQQYEITPPIEVVPGEVFLQSRMLEDKFDGCTVVIKRWLSPVDNPNIKVLISTQKRTSSTQKKQNIAEIKVPENLPLGKYYYVSRADWYCNFISYIFGPLQRTVSQPRELIVVPRK